MISRSLVATRLIAPSFMLGALMLTSLALGGCEKSSAAVQPTPAPVGITWNQQQTHVYRVELASTPQLSGAPMATTLVMRGQLDVSFRRNGAALQAVLRLVQPTLVDAAGKSASGFAPLEAELARPFAVELSRGIATAYLEPPTSGSLAPVAGFRRQLAALVQLGEHAPGGEWKSTEWDSTGLADIAYARDPKVPGAFSWNKLGYAKLVTSERRAIQSLDTTKLAPKIESAIGRVTMDASGLVTLGRKERLSVRLSAESTLTTELSAKLERTGLEPAAAPASWTSAERDWQRHEVGTPVQAFDPTTTDQARIGDHQFGEVVAKLQELEPKSGTARAPAAQEGPLFHALVAILRQRPEHLPEALQLVRNGSPIRDTLLDALAMASTSQTIEALGNVAFDKALPAPRRVRAAGALIRAKEPTENALELAVKMTGDPLLRDNGLYGLGSFVRQLREQNKPALANTGTQVLAQQLKLAKSPSELSTVLLAISNSGSAELFQPAAAYQKDTNASVRRAAIQAIRLMPQPEVEERLRAVLDSKERDEVVAALHSLGRRPKVSRETVDRVETLAKKDPSAEVRREAALALGLWSQLWPEVVKVLADLREHDPDARVRDVAKPLGSH
jgi:hypothetical protein